MQDIIREFISNHKADALDLAEHTKTPEGNDRFAYEYRGGLRDVTFEPNAVAFPNTYRDDRDHVARANYHALTNTYPWVTENEYGALFVSPLNAPNKEALEDALESISDLTDYPIFSELYASEEMHDELDSLWHDALDELDLDHDDHPTPDLEFGVHYDCYFDGELYLTDDALALLPETD